MKQPVNWFKSLSITKKLLLGAAVLFVLIGISGDGQQKNLTAENTKNTSQAQQDNQPQRKKHHKKKKTVVITTKTVTEKQAIPFASTTTQDPTLAKGTTKITTAGVNGSKELKYKITYKNGKPAKKELVGTTVTLQPVTQVTAVGTYVAPPKPASAPAPSCPNGTYVNSSGSIVCRPYSTPSAPAGATARCSDGTYSFSQHRSGTCSHHGGVAEWL